MKLLKAWLLLLSICVAGHVSLNASEVLPGRDGVFRFESCHASLQDGVLRIGNGKLERVWRLESGGGLVAESLFDAAARIEWVAAKEEKAYPIAEYPACQLSAETGPAGPTEEPSLRVTLKVPSIGGGLVHRFQIFPSVGAIIADRSLAEGSPGAVIDAPTCERLSRMESFVPAPKAWALTRVRFFDRTDLYAGPLVIERTGLDFRPEEANDSEQSVDGVLFRGNVFFIEDPQTSAGVLWLKHAPLPDERPSAMDTTGLVVRRLHDLSVQQGRVTLLSHELGGAGGRSYRTVALSYQGGRAGRIAALQRYHRQLRTYEPQRDGLMLCNFWGEWNNNKNLSVPFLEREIEAAGRLGVDVFEIDAGWHCGPFPNVHDRKKTEELGYYAINPDFWTFHPKKFPDGIRSLVAQARAQGMQFGLWFPPDSANELAAWEKDKARVLELHRNEGVNYFKFDMLRVYTRRAEQRLQGLIEELINESGGRLTIDLDVTGGHAPRPGYFGNPHHGPIFVENRWTHYPQQPPMPNPNEYWPRKDRYWPHRTLRNLWLLAQYMDPIRLRMEFMNNQRNQDTYGEDPLAPALWSPDYLFATVMCSSPLAWMEVQQLPPSYLASAAPLVAVWKEHRERMFHGSLIPVGAEPDGHAWTGFVSVAPEGTGGYALIFREVNAQSDWELPLPLFEEGSFKVTVLAGQGSASVSGKRLQVRIPSERSYVFLALQRK